MTIYLKSNDDHLPEPQRRGEWQPVQRESYGVCQRRRTDVFPAHKYTVERVCVKGANRKLAAIWRQENVNWWRLIDHCAAITVLAAACAYIIIVAFS